MNNNHFDKQLRELGQAAPPELPPSLRSRQDAVYASLASIAQDSAEPRKRRRLYPVITAAAAALVLGVMLTAAYPPQLAHALKQLPWVGGIFERADDLGLQAAERLGLISRPDSRITHEGITLSAEEAVFDGNRLVFSVKREGEGLESKLTGITVRPDGTFLQERGSISSAKVLIDGTTLEEFAEGHWEMMPVLSWIEGPESNTAIFKLVDSTNLSLSAQPFPEHFTLTVTIGLKGIEEPFVLQIPARKATQNTIDIHDQRVQADRWSLTLNKLEYSVLTTRLSLVLEHETSVDSLPVGFEVRDEQGQELKVISRTGAIPSGVSHNVDLLTEPFSTHPNKLSIRAFYYEFEIPGSTSGAFKTDRSGKPVIHYIDGLEIQVPVK